MLALLLELEAGRREPVDAAGLQPQVHISEGGLHVRNEVDAALHGRRRGPCTGIGSGDGDGRRAVRESAHEDAPAL